MDHDRGRREHPPRPRRVLRAAEREREERAGAGHARDAREGRRREAGHPAAHDGERIDAPGHRGAAGCPARRRHHGHGLCHRPSDERAHPAGRHPDGQESPRRPAHGRLHGPHPGELPRHVRADHGRHRHRGLCKARRLRRRHGHHERQRQGHGRNPPAEHHAARHQQDGRRRCPGRVRV